MLTALCFITLVAWDNQMVLVKPEDILYVKGVTVPYVTVELQRTHIKVARGNGEYLIEVKETVADIKNQIKNECK